MQRLLVLLILLGTNGTALSQRASPQTELDSLRSVLQEARHDTIKAITYARIAFKYVNTNTDSLRHYAQLGRQLSEAIDYERGMAHNLNVQARVSEITADYDRALGLQQRSITLFERLKDSTEMVAGLVNQGAIFLRARNLDSARYALERAEQIQFVRNETKWLANVYFSLGNLDKVQDRYADALRHYRICLDVARKNNDRGMEANALSGIAQLYFATGEIEKSIENYQRAIVVFRETGNDLNLAIMLSNLGGVYYDSGKYDLSSESLEEALRIKRRIGRNRSTAFTLGALGNLYLETKQFGKARAYYREAVSILLPDDYQLRFGLLFALGNLEYETGNANAASGYFQQALELQRVVKVPPNEVVTLLSTLSKVESKRSNYEDALRFNLSAQALQDSLNEAENRRELNELMTNFEVVEKERKIAALDAENRQQQLTAENISRQRLLLIISLVGLLLLALTLYSRFRTKQRLSEKLRLALDEREVLLKEIHHRVKNNLQLVMSLLNIQARELQNDQVNQFLEKGESRIASMALVHQTLYLNDDLSKVNIKEYVEGLLRSVFYTFGLPEDRYRYVVTVEDVAFDIQTVVPLGLILNELVCNALKHAFTDRAGGELRVSLTKKIDGYNLTVADDGIGFRDKASRKGSIGLELVAILTEQLNGTLSVDVEKGTTFSINFNEIANAA